MTRNCMIREITFRTYTVFRGDVISVPPNKKKKIDILWVPVELSILVRWLQMTRNDIT